MIVELSIPLQAIAYHLVESFGLGYLFGLGFRVTRQFLEKTLS